MAPLSIHFEGLPRSQEHNFFISQGEKICGMIKGTNVIVGCKGKLEGGRFVIITDRKEPVEKRIDLDVKKDEFLTEEIVYRDDNMGESKASITIKGI